MGEPAVEARQRTPHTLLSMDNLGNAYVQVGRLADGIPFLEEGLTGRRKALGPDNLKTFWSLGNLANAYTAAGNLTAARDLYIEGHARAMTRFGPDFPQTLVLLANRAECELRLGRPAVAPSAVLLSVCIIATWHRLNPWTYLCDVLDYLAVRSDGAELSDLLPKPASPPPSAGYRSRHNGLK